MTHPQLEPLLLELRDRVLQATGEEPREVLANRGFLFDGERGEIDRENVTAFMFKKHICYLYMWRGISIHCILPTDITTLVVRV